MHAADLIGDSGNSEPLAVDNLKTVLNRLKQCLNSIQMEVYNDILCISGTELIISEDNPAGLVSKSLYDWWRGKDKINVIRRGCRFTPVLVEYNSLPQKYREMYVDRFGEPSERAKTEPFIKRIKQDIKARDFYTTYLVDDGSGKGLKLSSEKVNQYTNDASILNALRVVMTEMNQSRRVKNIWDMAISAVNEAREIYTPCGLPNTAVTLKRRCEKFFKEGYEGLIHQGYANKNKAIITDEVAEALMIDLLSNGKQLDCAQVAETYNIWAESTKRKTITDRTVINFKLQHDFDIKIARDGEAKWRDKYDEVVRRRRPSAPLLLVNSDDNDLDLYFRAEYVEKKGGKLKVVKNDYFRYVVYVVMDAHCDYVLGYAVGTAQTKQLVKDAYRNAMQHVKELTGGYYLWHQIVADHWGLKSDLKEFYSKQAIFTPPRVKNARSKVIERAFGKEWHKTLKSYRNYAGHNITAKQQVNPEYIASHIKKNPTAEEGLCQIADFINTMRHLEWKESGQSRQQMWLKGFKESELAREKFITTETYLSLFGEENSRSSRITNGGLEITIGGAKKIYDIPVNIYRKAVGTKVKVVYDNDLSRVLITDGKALRFVATETSEMPMAMADFTVGDRDKLNAKLQIKKDRFSSLKNEKANRDAILERNRIDAESLLQANILVKEIKQEATNIYTQNIISNNSGSIKLKTLL